MPSNAAKADVYGEGALVKTGAAMTELVNKVALIVAGGMEIVWVAAAPRISRLLASPTGRL